MPENTPTLKSIFTFYFPTPPSLITTVTREEKQVLLQEVASLREEKGKNMGEAEEEMASLALAKSESDKMVNTLRLVIILSRLFYYY